MTGILADLIDALFHFQAGSFFPHVLSELSPTPYPLVLDRDRRRRLGHWRGLPLRWEIEIEWSIGDSIWGGDILIRVGVWDITSMGV